MVSFIGWGFILLGLALGDPGASVLLEAGGGRAEHRAAISVGSNAVARTRSQNGRARSEGSMKKHAAAVDKKDDACIMCQYIVEQCEIDLWQRGVSRYPGHRHTDQRRRRAPPRILLETQAWAQVAPPLKRVRANV